MYIEVVNMQKITDPCMKQNLLQEFIAKNECSLELLDYILQILCIKNKKKGTIKNCTMWLNTIKISTYSFLN